jgi:Icc-related predicted phosphoesterase|nr:metallophosphoesterase [Neorhizobium tomejilense]
MTKTLKAAVFSDLHLPFSQLDYKLELPVDVEVVIVAGDVTAPVGKSMHWLNENLAMAGYEVVFVAGNHEHYGQVYEDSMRSGYEARPRYPNVHFLENSEVTIKGVRFLGATMWTDFNLYENIPQAIKAARVQMNDYRAITSKDERGNPRFFEPEITREIHRESREWLRNALAVPHPGPTVVVTHHCPHYMSIAKKYSGDILNAAFTSDFDKEIREFQPEFWIHGHTHTNFDYTAPGSKTRVICNPRGYVQERFDRKEVENKLFEPFKTIEILLDV